MWALDLKGPLPKETPKASDNPRNIIKGNGEFFPFQASNPKTFPFLIFFERQLKAEWLCPATSKQSPSSMKRLYNLPDFANELLAVPLVDAPVLALQSTGLLSEDGQGSLRDSWDKKIEIALRLNHEATAHATASIVTRAVIVWGFKMLELLPESEHRLIEGATQMLKASSFAADSTLDGRIFASRALASLVVARQGVWLRAWQADLHSKQLAVAYTYKGGKLFGPSLEKILIETREKKKALLKTLHKSDLRGHSFRFPSFHANRFQG